MSRLALAGWAISCLAFGLAAAPAAHAQATTRAPRGTHGVDDAPAGDGDAPAPSAGVVDDGVVAPSTEAERDRRLLERGRISPGAYAGGALLAAYPGFGVGHAVQGRWKSGGWVFTMLDVVVGSALVGTTVALLASWPNERLEVPWLVFTVGFFVVRLVQFLDAIITPGLHNRRVLEAEQRQAESGTGLRVGSSSSPRGARAGLTLTF